MACVVDTMLPGGPVPYDAELVGHGWGVDHQYVFMC